MMLWKTAAAATTLLALAAPRAHAGIEFYDFTLDGRQEMPRVVTDAVGVATLEYDNAARLFDLDLFVNGLALGDITGAHIHRGVVGQNGPIVFDLLDRGNFQVVGDFLRLNILGVPIGGGSNEADLQAQRFYLNIHTRSNPGGEIRGQIVPGPGVLALMGVAGLIAARRRR